MFVLKLTCPSSGSSTFTLLYTNMYCKSLMLRMLFVAIPHSNVTGRKLGKRVNNNLPVCLVVLFVTEVFK